MSTIVFVHAHPDDEASSTSGTMRRAADAGHRVVVVYGTGGEHGAPPAELPEGVTVAEYRRAEAETSAQVTGTARVAWLGYHDSGMTGWEQNADPLAFTNADVDEAGARLAAILDEEDADVLVGYDWHGTYGHPDHVKVHHVTRAGRDLARRRPRLLEETMNRDHMRRLYEMAQEVGMTDMAFDPDGPADDGNPFGEPASALTYQVDVTDLVETKRAALACHASQPDAAGMLQMPVEIFALAFGTEWFIDVDDPQALHEVHLPF